MIIRLSPYRHPHAVTLSVLSLAALATGAGCSFSASASGKVETGGETTATADASLTTGEEAEAPAPAAASSIVYKEGKLDYEGVINFEYNDAALKDDADTQRTLDEFAKFLGEHPQVSVEVQGHTDSRGTDAYNRSLSDRRAESVKKWLVAHGVAEARLTSVGKGEDEPQVPEPAACNDVTPADTAPCEETWAKNRRVVFGVTKGAETLPEPAAPVAEPEPEPTPEPAAPVAAKKPKCPWLVGGHLNAVGPNSWVIGAGAVQPGICWLEPSLGVGLGTGPIDAEDPPADTMGEGRHYVLNVPLRARIWFMDRHALVGDVGLGLARYFISADVTDSAGVDGEYSRDSTGLHGHLGLGYGFRPNRAQAGPRFAIVGGALLPFTDLKTSELDVPAAFDAAEAAALRSELDDDTDRLTNLEPYGELSLGWLF